MNIADQSEQEMIKTILLIYTGDDKACHEISKHIAEKLTQRRTIIRQRKPLREIGRRK